MRSFLKGQRRRSTAETPESPSDSLPPDDASPISTHKRGSSLGTVAPVAKHEVLKSSKALQAATESGHGRSLSSNSLVGTAKSAGYYRNSSSSSTSTLTAGIASSPSSTSLKKLKKPMQYFRKAGFDLGSRRASDAATSLEDYKDAGVIYGTRTHEWGSGPSRHSSLSGTTPTTPTISDVFTMSPVSSEAYTADTPELASGEDSETAVAVSPETNGITAIAEEDSSEVQEDKETQEDKESVFSFQVAEEPGIGRNSSQNYYKKERPRSSYDDFYDGASENSLALCDEYNLDDEEDEPYFDGGEDLDLGPIRSVSPLRIVKSPALVAEPQFAIEGATLPQTYSELSEYVVEDFDDDDIDYDNLIDEANAVTDVYYDDLNPTSYPQTQPRHRGLSARLFRHREQVGASLDFNDDNDPDAINRKLSLTRRNSRVIQLKENTITVYDRPSPSTSRSSASSGNTTASTSDPSEGREAVRPITVNTKLDPLPTEDNLVPAKLDFERNIDSLSPISERCYDSEATP